MKNALLVVVAFALGAGAVWYFNGNRSDGGAAQRGGPARGRRRGGRPAGGAPGGFAGRPAQQAPLVTAGTVSRDQVYDVVEALGTAQANESVTLTAKVSDTVRRVNFEDGDYVEKGAVLIELTNQEEEAALAEARANLDDAQNQLRRLEDLSKPRFVGRAAARHREIARRCHAGAAEPRRGAFERPDRSGAIQRSARLSQREPRHARDAQPRRSRRSTTSPPSSSTSRCPRRCLGSMKPGAKVDREERELPGPRVRRRRAHSRLARRSRYSRGHDSCARAEPGPRAAPRHAAHRRRRDSAARGARRFRKARSSRCRIARTCIDSMARRHGSSRSKSVAADSAPSRCKSGLARGRLDRRRRHREAARRRSGAIR